ncbi:MAG: response regulator [Bacteroidales bacterium]
MDTNHNRKAMPFKIMIVDDDPMVIKSLERLLFKKNFLFFSVDSGEKALEMVRQIKPDAILLDVLMQGLTGYQVCSELRRNPDTSEIPVIFLTATTETEDVLKGFHAGAVDFIRKPFQSEELLVRLETHVQLKRAREEIQMMNLLKTKFFSIVTHDIRDAFTGVKGVADFLHQELQSPDANMDEALKLSQILTEDSRSLYLFLDNLIQWDTIEQGKEELHIQTFDALELTKEVVVLHSGYINQKELHVNIKPLAPAIMTNAPAAFQGILKRLLSNAIKYSNPGGEILISLHKTNGANVLSIADKGVGMEKEVIENVFRLDTPHPKTIGTRNERGVGLGLIICKSLSDKMKGQISLESEKHKGTLVTLTFPDLDPSNYHA